MGKRTSSRFGMVLIVAVMNILFLSGFGIAAEFSADLILKQNGEVLTGKVYIQGEKIRQEFSKEGEKQVVILRMDKGFTWNLMPEEKVYIEISNLEGAVNDPELEQKIRDMAEKKYLGREKVNGYVCEKYQFIYHDKSLGVLTQWFSKKLNYPIRVEHKSPSGYMLTEYKDIEEKSVPHSLFEIPAGYTKMSLPAMPPR